MMKKRGKALLRYKTRIVKIGRRIARSSATSPIGAYVGGQILGRLEASGTLAKLPSVLGTDPILNAGIVGYGLQRWAGVHNKWLRDVTLVALGIGGYRAGAAGRLFGDEGVIG